ncbi:protein-L-isoaspartate (D-aspartate) O-methyltransferase [Aureococcus anophagefferens]|nr:protein-L-isoaspartate (D-aspartate) O-methyltransferase [Aureococcus anophagefferens]
MSIAGSEDSFEEMVPELVAMPPPPPADAEVAEAKAPESGDDDDGEALSDSERHAQPRDEGGGEGLGGRPVRLRTALALVRHMMLANRGSETLEAMVDMLVRERSVSSPPVVAAFRAVDRAAFLPAAVRDEAYVNMPVRHGLVHQSSPSVYGSALEALDLKPGLFLNVGSGTGYFSALAAQLLGPDAVHVGLERHADLVRHARKRCAAAGVVGVCFEVGDATTSTRPRAPEAAARDVPRRRRLRARLHDGRVLRLAPPRAAALPAAGAPGAPGPPWTPRRRRRRSAAPSAASARTSRGTRASRRRPCPGPTSGRT